MHRKITLLLATLALSTALGTGCLGGTAAELESQGIRAPSKPELDELQNKLIAEVEQGADVASFTDTYLGDKCTVEIKMTSGLHLSIEREWKSGQTLNDEKFSQFRILAEGQPGTPQAPGCLLTELRRLSRSHDVLWIGALFNKQTLFFGYSDGEALAYDVEAKTCTAVPKSAD